MVNVRLWYLTHICQPFLGLDHVMCWRHPKGTLFIFSPGETIYRLVFWCALFLGASVACLSQLLWPLILVVCCLGLIVGALAFFAWRRRSKLPWKCEGPKMWRVRNFVLGEFRTSIEAFHLQYSLIFLDYWELLSSHSCIVTIYSYILHILCS